MDDEYSGRLGSRSEPHPFDEKMRDLLGHLNEAKSKQEETQSLGGQQQPDPQQVAMAQQQMAAMMAQQKQGMFLQGLQSAIQIAQNMDPVQRYSVASKMRDNVLAGMQQDENYHLNNSALASKGYPSEFGKMGRQAQQILLASGMLDSRQPHNALVDNVRSNRNYLAS